MNGSKYALDGRIHKPRRRRAVVTGCAGFLGSHLTGRLLSEGWEVQGLDCFTDYYPRLLKEHNLAPLRGHSSFSFRELDLSSADLSGIIGEGDAVFHLAAQAGVRGSFGTTFGTYARNNIVATQAMLEAAVEGEAGTFVYASSSSVYGDAPVSPTPEGTPLCPVSPYGMTKVATEYLAGVYARVHGLRTVGLRYFTVYGPRQRPDMAFSRFIQSAIAGRPLTVLGDGRQIRDFTYVDDIVDATVAAADVAADGALVLNVGGGCPVPLIRVFALLEGILDRPLLLEHRPGQIGDARHTAADVSQAADVLGFSPRVGLVEGMRAQVEWTLEDRSAIPESAA